MTAVKLIKAEIKEMVEFNKDTYPTDESMASIDEGERWLLTTLIKFLDMIVPTQIKYNSNGQCMVYAACPQYVLPQVLFGLGVQADHMFESPWLVDQLSCLGYSITHEEVSRYKHLVLQSERIEDNIPNAQCKP